MSVVRSLLIVYRLLFGVCSMLLVASSCLRVVVVCCSVFVWFCVSLCVSLSFVVVLVACVIIDLLLYVAC